MQPIKEIDIKLSPEVERYFSFLKEEMERKFKILGIPKQ